MNEGLALHLRRTVRAPCASVWQALTDPDRLVHWWGPHGFTAPTVDFEPRVGGGYRIEMQPPEGEAFFLTGEFREVDPPSRLSFTFIWDPPDPDDQETLATLVLKDRGDETEIEFTQGPFTTEARRALHEGGWGDGFERLERFLARS